MDFETICAFVVGWFVHKLKRFAKGLRRLTWAMLINRDIRLFVLARVYIAVVRSAAHLRHGRVIRKQKTIGWLDRLFTRLYRYFDRRIRELGWNDSTPAPRT